MLPHYLVEIEANGNEYTRNKWRVQTAFCERVFVWQDNIAAGGCSRMARLAKLPKSQTNLDRSSTFPNLTSRSSRL